MDRNPKSKMKGSFFCFVSQEREEGREETSAVIPGERFCECNQHFVFLIKNKQTNIHLNMLGESKRCKYIEGTTVALQH